MTPDQIPFEAVPYLLGLLIGVLIVTRGPAK